MQKIKKGDTVKILTGKDSGKSGKVLEVREQEDRIIVEGVNLVTEHRRARRMNEKGQKVIKPAPLHVSNAMVVCSSCGKPSKIGFDTSSKGEKVRICKKCNGSV